MFLSTLTFGDSLIHSGLSNAFCCCKQALRGNHKEVTDLFHKQHRAVCNKCISMQRAKPGESQWGLDGKRVLKGPGGISVRGGSRAVGLDVYGYFTTGL